MRNIIDEIIKQIEETVPELRKLTIITQKPETNKLTSFPTIGVYDTGFSFASVGMSDGFGLTKEEAEEEFSGDGSNRIFKLKSGPIRPLISVQHPIGYAMKEGLEFTVDYVKGLCVFKSAPQKIHKGKNNILVRYAIAKSASEVKAVRIKLVCNFDVWGKNPVQCDSAALEIVKAMLFAVNALASKHIIVKPLSGMNLSLTGGGDGKDDKKKELSGRRLVYLAETDLKFDVKIPLIQKIGITEKEIQPRK